MGSIAPEWWSDKAWSPLPAFNAFLYSSGKMVDLGGGYQASASAINDSGQIVGDGTTAGAFLYSDGKMVSLVVPSGASGSGANAIYSSGQIVGVIYFNSGPSHAALGPTVSIGAEENIPPASNQALQPHLLL